jgi:hypothetical protein
MTVENPTATETARIERLLSLANSDPELAAYIMSILGEDAMREALKDRPSS